MVLQRAPHRAVIWGFGSANKLTTLQINTKTYTSISRVEPANNIGESIWSISLDPVSDEGPYNIQVTQPLDNDTLCTIT
ncbi:unnamed protein product, partial [Rotaria sp. Silwood1]